MKILADAIAKVLGLADVDDLSLLIAEKITTRLGWQIGECFLERHRMNASRLPKNLGVGSRAAAVFHCRWIYNVSDSSSHGSSKFPATTPGTVISSSNDSH